MQPFHIQLSGPSRGPLPTSFEEVESRLSQLSKLYFEPDGSFVWARAEGKEQLFGMVYDAMGAVQYCEIRGQCRQETWTSLCEAVIGPSASGAELQVLSLPGGILQDLQTFEQRQWPSDSPE